MNKLIKYFRAFKRINALETEVFLLREDLELTRRKLQQAKLQLLEIEVAKSEPR